MLAMGQRRHHYEAAFEAFLRARRVPYVSVNEARAALLPEGAALKLEPTDPDDPDHPARPQTLKNFDFTIYGETENLLVEVKGRKLARPRGRSKTTPEPTLGRPSTKPLIEPKPRPRGRLESWVSRDDVESLGVWQELFGPAFDAVFVFMYWCDEQPPDALFEEIFEHHGRWYALRCIRLSDYRSAMRTRSERWRTVHLRGQDFDALSRPFAPPTMGLAEMPGGSAPALVPIP